MKIELLALGALTAFAVTAQAQTNVTVYGLIDNGIEYTSNANATKNGLTRLQSGGMNTSRIGFRGTEDLGGGLKAVFQLESGIKTDTGELDSAGLIFGRQANVGLEGNFGRVVAGKSYSTTYDFILPFDPMGYAPDFSWATSAGATGGRKDGMLTAVNNVIKYQGQFGDFKLGASYGFGETAGNTSDSAKYAFGFAYGSGPFGLAATYDQVNGTVAANGDFDKAKSAHFGGTYKLSDSVKLFAAYRGYKKTLASNAADLRSNTYWGGVGYQVTPALTLTGAVYYQDIKNVPSGADADPSLYVLRAKYGLSKRTDLYAAVAYASAKNNKLVGVSRDDAGFGTSQNGFIMGVQHRF